jgi:hypothetical protein
MRHHQKHTHKVEESAKEQKQKIAASAEHGHLHHQQQHRHHHHHSHQHAHTQGESRKASATVTDGTVRQHPHHHAHPLRVHQHNAVELNTESGRLSPSGQGAKTSFNTKLSGSSDGKKILPESTAVWDGASYSIANSGQMCEPGYEPIDDLIECQTAMTAFGAEWAAGEPCEGGPKGCSIRRDILPKVSWVDTPSDPDETDFPRCNVLCKKAASSLLEIDSEPQGPSVSATCPDGYAREFGDSEPEWGDMVLGSYWGGRHADNIDECAGQCSNLTDCMSFKWSPNYLQGAVPEHPCILTVNAHITTNSTFHDFIFCAKATEGTDVTEAGEAQEESLYAQTGNEGLKRRLLKKDSRQDFPDRSRESASTLGIM